LFCAVCSRGPKTISVPVMGVFEFKGDLIAAWRDYFDLPGFQRQMA
jgi:limonene-1,2-epoxide hydrolase